MYEISEECVQCGSCAAVCPNDAISQGEDRYLINQELCTECGTCSSECPVEAIKITEG